MRLLDDNLTAKADLFIATCEELAQRKLSVYFDSLDIRFICNETAAALALTKPVKYTYRFAWDRPQDEDKVIAGIELLKRAGIKAYKLMFYVLIGAGTTPEEDLHRVETLRRLGVKPFVMAMDKTDPYQRRFARYVNHKAIFMSIKWEEYK